MGKLEKGLLEVVLNIFFVLEDYSYNSQNSDNLCGVVVDMPPKSRWLLYCFLDQVLLIIT